MAMAGTPGLLTTISDSTHGIAPGGHLLGDFRWVIRGDGADSDGTTGMVILGAGTILGMVGGVVTMAGVDPILTGTQAGATVIGHTTMDSTTATTTEKGLD